MRQCIHERRPCSILRIYVWSLQVSALVAQLFQMRARMKSMSNMLQGGALPGLEGLEDPFKGGRKVLISLLFISIQHNLYTVQKLLDKKSYKWKKLKFVFNTCTPLSE